MRAIDSGEEWRAIPFAPGYEASNYGRVRSIDRACGPMMKRGCVLQQREHFRGFRLVNLNIRRRRTTLYVHAIVARTFLGDPPYTGARLRHRDGDRANNAAWNLEWHGSAERFLPTTAHQLGGLYS